MNLLKAVSTRFLVKEKANHSSNTSKKPAKDLAALLEVQKELSNLVCADCGARGISWSKEES